MNHSPVDGRQKAMSAFPSPVKSAGAMRSVEAPNCRANVRPVERRLIHHSATGGRKMPISVLPSPSKSNGAWCVGTVVAPPPQKPLASEKVPPVDGPPATGWPIVPSREKVPAVARPPPPAITDFVIVKL